MKVTEGKVTVLGRTVEQALAMVSPMFRGCALTFQKNTVFLKPRLRQHSKNNDFGGFPETPGSSLLGEGIVALLYPVKKVPVRHMSRTSHSKRFGGAPPPEADARKIFWDTSPAKPPKKNFGSILVVKRGEMGRRCTSESPKNPHFPVVCAAPPFRLV